MNQRGATTSAPVPNVLSIAGSDPSGGAGIQADLKTFSALGAYGMSVLTALTAQNTHGVTDIHVIGPGFLRAQLDTLLADVRVDAVKIGMLADADLAAVITDYVCPGGPFADVPVVLDPVMVATSGDRLLDDDAVEAVRALLPFVDIVTPNVAELAVLTDSDPVTDLASLHAQADRLCRRFGATRVYAKGGHLPDTTRAVDLLVERAADGATCEPMRLDADRIRTEHTHGTGCSLSSALAALRPRHADWCRSALAAKAWLTRALEGADSLDVGTGHGPVHHFVDLWSPR